MTLEHLDGAPSVAYVSEEQHVGLAELGLYVARIKASGAIGAVPVGAHRVGNVELGTTFMSVLVDLEWSDEGAACAGRLDVAEQFTAPQVGNQIPAEARPLAREFCARCPVIVECGADADRHRALGLWGGAYRAGAKPGTYSVTQLVPLPEPATAAVPTPAAVATTTTEEPAA
ncbi:MAG TPA: WhiB family transcriptional regulator [Naasia sp.]|jgi:hypothetical protein